MICIPLVEDLRVTEGRTAMFLDLSSRTLSELFRELTGVERALQLLASSETETALDLMTRERALRAELGRRRQNVTWPGPVRGLPIPRRP